LHRAGVDGERLAADLAQALEAFTVNQSGDAGDPPG
jgi:hypothetical protein